MKTIKINTFSKKIIADTITPVEIYLKIRDKFPNSILLESSDYMQAGNNYSFICFNQTGFFELKNHKINQKLPGQNSHEYKVAGEKTISDYLNDFIAQFDTEKTQSKFISNGLFGYMAHESIQYQEKINFNSGKDDLGIPDIYYGYYQNIVAISLFNHEAHIYCNSHDNSNNIDEVEGIINLKNYSTYNYKNVGPKTSNIDDKGYLEYVNKAKEHCKRGDVFQLVLSRRFSQKFEGDEFNVYRSLRSINPSPYLFFFDYGSFKIFGSSPEAQIIVNNGKAEIHPIAGTFRRTGDDTKDEERAKKLSMDPKENSEHIMLVDLARNDLSRNGSNVKVEKNREIQFYSHVIHLVSKVTSVLKDTSKIFQIVMDTFPAGTLTGAPKHKALTLIEKYEKINRNFYGGAIGYMDFEGNFNHAIIIRSFFSKNNELSYQAGAGIVIKSNPKDELQEVYNKLGALDKALENAENII